MVTINQHPARLETIYTFAHFQVGQEKLSFKKVQDLHAHPLAWRNDEGRQGAPVPEIAGGRSWIRCDCG